MGYAAILGKTSKSGLYPTIVISSIGATLTSVTVENSSGKQYTVTSEPPNWIAEVDDFDTYTVTGTYTGGTTTQTVDVNINQEYNVALIAPSSTLNDNSWEIISQVSQENVGQNLWSVGDTKQITINGTIGSAVTYNNYTTYVYIIGFNHNQSVEGNGITFGGLKTAQTSGIDIVLVDDYYGASYTIGMTRFNMNSSGNTNTNGWKGCNMRYNILGSSDSYNGNATTNTPINPNTTSLMAALTIDLRSVMKPMTIYTDNVGGGTNVQSNVTTSVDYLPLLAEFEVFGTRTYANSYEQNYQKQYQYYMNGNSKVKYRYNSISSTAYWWERSPDCRYNSSFCVVNTNGNKSYESSSYSYGIAPIFRV